MNGPEHYKTAEEHLRFAGDAGAENTAAETVHLAYAQVHATLALAAATALGAVPQFGVGGNFAALPAGDAKAWHYHAGSEPKR